MSSADRKKRASVDVSIEDENAMSTSTHDGSRSPIGRMHPDCEVSKEEAQKAEDVWNSLQSSPRTNEAARPYTSWSDISREKDFCSPSPSEESSSVEVIPCRRVSATSPRGLVGFAAPASEWSSLHGGGHAKTVAVRTPGSESHADPIPSSQRSTPQAQDYAHHQPCTMSPSTGQQRTPLPSRREQSPSHNGTTSPFGAMARPSTELSQPLPSISEQYLAPMDQQQTDESQVSGADGNSQEISLNSWGVSSSMRESQELNSQRPSWTYGHRGPEPQAPQSDDLPNVIGSPAANTGYNMACTVPSNMPSRDSGPFSTFPSSFSVLTTESVQQKFQAKSGKKRGRKPANQNVEQPVSEPAVDRSAGVAHEYARLREASNTSQTNHETISAQSGLPAISVSHGFYQTKLPPRPTLTPPPRPSAHPSGTYRPPAIEFTINNEAQSDLSPSDFQSCVDKFKRNARAIVTRINNPNSVHEIDVIMFEPMPWFLRWYLDTTGMAEVGTLKFELIDVHWLQDNSIVVPEGDLLRFRALKQHIWDLYWIAMDMNKSLGRFRVTISPYPPLPEGEAAAAHEWKAVNSGKGAANYVSAPPAQRILVVPTGVPKKFQAQPQSSPPSQEFMFSPPPPPPPPPSTSTHQVSPHSDSQASAYHLPRPSPPNLPAKFPSPDQSTYQHGPYSGDPFSPPPKNNAEIRDVGIKSQQQQSLYSPVEYRRSIYDQQLLREYALSLNLPNAELLPEESTVKDKLPYKTGSEVCAVVVDKRSGKGQVTVSGKGYVTLAIPTGPNEPDEHFKKVIIQPKQTCMLHGGAVVLYFRRLNIPPPPTSRPIMPTAESNDRYAKDGRPPSSSNDQGLRNAAFRDDRPPPPPLSPHPHYLQNLQRQERMSSSSNVDIKIRVQVDGTGKFSIPFDKSVLRPKINTTEFFSWFASQSRQSPPHPPRHLKFTFKDAMPMPQATEISAGNEDHFNYMRKDIKVQCEKAKRFMPELKEFVILVTVPGLVSPNVEEEEEDW